MQNRTSVSMSNSTKLRDLVYFDINKAASIFSQLEMGLITETKSTKKDSMELINELLKREESIPREKKEVVLSSEEEKTKIEKKLTLESKVLHHDLLTRVEDLLFEENLIIDISSQLNNEVLSICEQPLDSIRASIGEIPYLRAEGLAAIEDYERIQKIANKFNDILEPIKYSLFQGISQTNEYQEAVQQIDILKSLANDPSQEYQKEIINEKVKQLEALLQEQIQVFLASHLGETIIPQWLIDAIDLYINTFMKGRVNIRIYPFDSFPHFQVIANLKRDCLLDSDLENLLFAYGTQTNLKLTVIGLITSLPPRENNIFNPMDEFNYEVEPQMEQARAWEKAFRGLFAGFQEIEKFMRFVSYPSVVIYPLAVYRTIRDSKNTKTNLKNGRNNGKTRKSRSAAT
jgi:hypothetical protein